MHCILVHLPLSELDTESQISILKSTNNVKR